MNNISTSNEKAAPAVRYFNVIAPDGVVWGPRVAVTNSPTVEDELLESYADQYDVQKDFFRLEEVE